MRCSLIGAVLCVVRISVLRGCVRVCAFNWVRVHDHRDAMMRNNIYKLRMSERNRMRTFRKLFNLRTERSLIECHQTNSQSQQMLETAVNRWLTRRQKRELIKSSASSVVCISEMVARTTSDSIQVKYSAYSNVTIIGRSRRSSDSFDGAESLCMCLFGQALTDGLVVNKMPSNRAPADSLSCNSVFVCVSRQRN